MKKIIIFLSLCLFTAAPAFAQDNVDGMRILTINTLLEYGAALYDRGDFDEASAVFNHVLKFDHHQTQALEYLKEMGYVPVELDQPTNKSIDMSTENLSKAIEAQKKTIAILRNQIKEIRKNISSQSTI